MRRADYEKRRPVISEGTSQMSTRMVIGVVLTVTLVGCQGSSMKQKAPATGKDVRFEHIALNLNEPQAAAEWYCGTLGMKVIRSRPAENVFFVSDAGGHMMFELYHNPSGPVPDYVSIGHASLHISFVVDNVDVLRTRLIAAGARPIGEATTTAGGDKVANMRDPWGVPIQFIQRAEPMLGPVKK